MLKFYIFKFRFFRYIQSGLYLDFFFKKLAEVFVRNVFIYTAQFFAEKYIIEFLTKKIIDSSIFNFNRLFGVTELFYSYYFIQIISLFFYFISIINLVVWFI
jgi:hypothetical protein